MRTDLGRSVRLTTPTKLMWLNGLRAQPFDSSQQPYDQNNFISLCPRPVVCGCHTFNISSIYNKVALFFFVFHNVYYIRGKSITCSFGRLSNRWLNASVTIMADFCPQFNPPFRWRCKHQTKIAVHINNLVSSEFLNRFNRNARSFISTLNCT